MPSYFANHSLIYKIQTLEKLCLNLAIIFLTKTIYFTLLLSCLFLSLTLLVIFFIKGFSLLSFKYIGTNYKTHNRTAHRNPWQRSQPQDLVCTMLQPHSQTQIHLKV